MIPPNPAQPPPKRLANPAIPEAIETISFPGRAADGELDGEAELPVAGHGLRHELTLFFARSRR